MEDYVDRFKARTPATADSIAEYLRPRYQATFFDLCRNSNEQVDVDDCLSYIDRDSSQIVGGWINDSLEARGRAILKGRIKPHHVMLQVLCSARSLIQSGRSLERYNRR